MFTVQPTDPDVGAQPPTMPPPSLGPAPPAHDPITHLLSSSPNPHAALARGNNTATALDDSDRTLTTGSSSSPAHTQNTTQLMRHDQGNRGPLSRIVDEDEDMQLARPIASSSKMTLHDDNDEEDNDDSAALQLRRRKRLRDDDDDDDDDTADADQSRRRKRLGDNDEDEDNEDEDDSAALQSRRSKRLGDDDDDNDDDDGDGDAAWRSCKCAAPHTNYDITSGCTSKARVAKKNAGAASTSKGKGGSRRH